MFLSLRIQDNPEKEEVQEILDDLEDKEEKLDEAARKRRSKLQDIHDFLQFNWEVRLCLHLRYDFQTASIATVNLALVIRMFLRQEQRARVLTTVLILSAGRRRGIVDSGTRESREIRRFRTRFVLRSEFAYKAGMRMRFTNRSLSVNIMLQLTEGLSVSQVEVTKYHRLRCPIT